MPDVWERARQRDFGANRYMEDETAEVPRPGDEENYTAEELAAARADWSDFNLPRPSLSRNPKSQPRTVPGRGFVPPADSAESPDAETPQTHAYGATATAPIPTPSFEEREWHRNIRDLEHRLLGAERSLTYREMALRMGVSTHSARKLWRALGFPNLDEDVKAFTEADAEALAQMVNLVRQGYLNQETAISLTRSVGQMTDRMVVWQIEALVEDKIANQELSDAEARSHVFETLPALIDPLHQLMGYAWRRQLSAALQRLTVRVESGLASLDRGREGAGPDQSRDDAPLPLARAVGFADLVSYTSLSRQMNERTLAHMVQRFESKCAEIISIGGGRLVKTVGDEVLYNAETPEAGAEIALALSESIAADDVLPEARVSVVWGRVLSRMGDIYGPTVNLAARLTSLADPGTILVDSSTAEALEVSQEYLLVPQPPRLVRGFGEVAPSMLLRAGTGGIALDNS
ncbi:adenylate/guanylate cyclase domain-containing protein [Nesterenkonia haasae]|uniref:adenylate/guanylate cyclase domain-containing protein n=1 Tax=Nesterenkonia haasae TaxID=2587813 RepID=UPI002E286CD8|nr:adenylate/guanylate cyclase domain-containing protein [Nesterenkonia haasae]